MRWFASVALTLSLALGLLATQVAPVGAARVPDVTNTKHNLSVTGPGTLKATTENQVCVFCHTPHAAENIPAAPLWNRKLSAATYTTYTSSSIEASAAELAAGPGGTSKLCLSCHDGTMAIGNVNVLNGRANQTIALGGTGPGGTMAVGAGAATGFTRNLGVNLTNDHPISFTYDAALAAADGELRTPDGVTVGTRVAGQPKPKLPLEAGKMQCNACHDPHLRETDTTKGPGKFLRANRFQETAPIGGAFNEAADIVCLACHDKGGSTWALSAHAHPQVADEVYSPAAAALREFPANLPVWKGACLNCHDTHSVQGSRRLLREGTDSAATPKSGGNAAQEETCYQCHSDLTRSALTNVTSVPNVRNDFTDATSRRMPIGNVDQGGEEVHDIGTGTGTQRGKDFVEAPALLGKGAPSNRHVECTDCHNPHRTVKNRLFNANPATPDAAGTHNHAAGHTNIASGALKGTTGVEPVYGGVAFGTNPLSFDFKRGDGGIAASTAVTSPWVTREYQVCLKCHSNYAYDTPPALGASGGGTPSGTNGLINYTNTAMEFQAPAAHRGRASTSDSGAFAGTPPGRTYTVNFQTNNHRSWHPVIDRTGRTNGTSATTGRTTTVASWVAPWGADADVGSQTMYCSDCHGSNTAAGTVVPTGGENGNPWGPHGWKNKALLVNLNDVGAEGGLAPGTQVRNNITTPYNNPPYYLNAVLKVRTFAVSGSWLEASCGSVGAPGNGQSGRAWMRDSSENCVSAP